MKKIAVPLCALLLALCQTALAADPVFHTSAGDVTVSTVARGLEYPWSLAFMPDGEMLVTERPGRMRIVARDGRLSPAVSSVPRVFAEGQAGLEDVILARDFAQSHTIFFCYGEAADGGGRIAVARAKLVVDETPHLDAVKIIFHQKGPVTRGTSIINIGCRMVQAPDGNLFVTLGDHAANSIQARPAQTLDNHIGKIIRIRPDGSVPPDNRFVKTPGALPEIWAYGIRNAEGLSFNPADGKLWEQEHGPKGGDEINIIQKGGNYGWPVVSFGVNYDGSPVGDGKQHANGMIDSIWHWTPSIATSGMMFYTGDLFPQWKGSLFNGALKLQLVSRVTLDGDKAVKEERMLQDLNERIRDVRQGPDGAIYLLTDNIDGRILRMAPAGK
jgi:glucose/arabinose dehydrogenase